MSAARIAALLIVVTGCGQSRVQPTNGRVFGTHAEAFTTERTRWGFEVVIPFTYSNTTQDSLFITNCNAILPITVQKQVGSEWVSPVVSGYPACLSEPIVIAPNSELVDTVRVIAAMPQAPDSSVAGTYRLVWHGIVTNYGKHTGRIGDSIPLINRVSNSFALRPTR